MTVAPRLDESTLAAFGMAAGAAASYALFFGSELVSVLGVNSHAGLYGSLLAGLAACRLFCRQKACDP
jgi:hypothetical protein